jgi:MFS superfamily sulfate permease-like transporter
VEPTFRRSHAVRVEGHHGFRDRNRYPEGREVAGVRVVRLDESLTFVDCDHVRQEFTRVARWEPWGACVVVWRCVYG